MTGLGTEGFLDLAEQFRCLIWRRVKAKHVSQSVIARDSNLTQAHISNWLSGRREMSMPALDRIRVSQGVTLDEIREVQ